MRGAATERVQVSLKEIPVFATALAADQWDGPRDSGQVIHLPTMEQIETAIRDLDGHTKTVVMLTAAGSAHLAVGGGNGGRFIVSGSHDGRTYFDLAVPGVSAETQGPETMFTLVTGGQTVEYPSRQCAGLESALRAARAFAVDGSFDRSLTWDRR
jgi:hypothetical protein